MAASMKSKFCDRLAVHERFRINLESIINKYDKPFEDSPILDLHKMSSVSDSLEDLNIVQPFGWTPLATDLQKGKKRKGGVSCDSALGSTLSPSKSYDSSDEESSGNIQLQNYDFTHETSDTLGGFIRYKHLSMSKAPEIAGLKTDDLEYGESSDSDDDLGSVRSGPTYPLEKCTERRKDNEIDIIEVDRTRQTDDVPDCDIRLDERSPQDKVRSWLSDDAFMNTSRHRIMDEDCGGDVSTTEMESEFSSSLSEGSPGDETKSLLEIKERFVRRVKSILVEGNNETEDISSSADETGGFSQRMTDERTEGKNNSSRTVNVRGGEIDRSSYPADPRKARGNMLLKGALSSTICDEASTVTGIRNQNGSRDKPVMLAGDETTIIAGHFDDEIVSPECQDVGKDVTDLSTVQNGFELVHSPGGKMEWTSYRGRSKLAKKTLPSKTHQVKNRVELQDIKQPQTCLTPTKTKLASGLTEIMFKTPQGKCTLPFKSRVSRTTSDNPETCQGIIGDIMDFFKSPLPELLTSPMPVLSPKGRQRTAQGKRVTRNATSKPEVSGRTCHSTDTLQESSPSKSKQSPSAMVLRQDVATGSTISLDQSSHSSIRASKETVIDSQSSKLSCDDTLTTTKGPHCVQERHAEPHPIEHSLSTEEEADISLLTEDSSEESTPFQFPSISRITNAIPNTPTQPCHSNKLVKVPETPSQSSIPRNTLEIGSKTPSITSPFSRMRVNSAEKDHTKVRRVQEKGRRDNLPHSSKSLVYNDRNQRDSRDGTENKPDMELLVFSSSDDELEYKQEQKARSYSPEIAKSEDVSHPLGSTTPHQIENNRILSQGNSMEDKSGSNDRLAHKCIGNDVICSIEKFSDRRTNETRTSIQAQNKITEFEQTYIVSDRERKTCTPHRMSPSRRKIDKDQKQWKKNTQISSSSRIQFTFSKKYEDECKSNELKHKTSTSHRIREEHSSLAKRDDRRSACTSPLMANQDDRHSRRQYKEHGVILQNKDCRSNRPKERTEETPNAKYRSSNLHEPQTNHQHILTDRVSGRRDSTFTRSPEYKSNVHTMGGNEAEICVDNEVTSSPRSEVGSNAVLKEVKLSTTPKSKHRHHHSASRSKFTTSDSASYEHSSDGKTKDEQRQRPFTQPAKLNDIPRDCYVRQKSPRHQKILIQQEKVSRDRRAVRDVSFLSSTRIDEDMSEGLKSKDLDRTMSSSSRLMTKEQSADEKQIRRLSGTHQGAIQENLSTMTDQTPWKRRRRGSDRSNSLESPAKRRTQPNARRSSLKGSQTYRSNSLESPAKRRTQPNARRSSLKGSQTYRSNSLESPAKTRTPPNARRSSLKGSQTDRSNSLESPAKRRTPPNARRSSLKGSQTLDRVLDSSDDSDIAVKEWNEGSLSSSSLSLSSMCEGPGRCIKKICFKCTMNE